MPDNKCIVCKRQIHPTEDDPYFHDEKQLRKCADIHLENLMKKVEARA